MAWDAAGTSSYPYPGQRETRSANQCPECTIGTLHRNALIGFRGEQMLVCGVCQTVLCAVCRGETKEKDGKYSCCVGHDAT